MERQQWLFHDSTRNPVCPSWPLALPWRDVPKQVHNMAIPSTYLCWLVKSFRVHFPLSHHLWPLSPTPFHPSNNCFSTLSQCCLYPTPHRLAHWVFLTVRLLWCSSPYVQGFQLFLTHCSSKVSLCRLTPMQRVSSVSHLGVSSSSPFEDNHATSLFPVLSALCQYLFMTQIQSLPHNREPLSDTKLILYAN